MRLSAGLPRVVVADDLQRSRLTTFFRLVLALPHFVWLSLWGAVMILLLPVMWVMTLVNRRPNAGLHEVYAMYLRYTLHVYAYASLAANPFPGFLGAPNSYPVDLVVPAPAEQNRWSVGFRLVLAIPAFIMASALGSGMVTSAGSAISIGVGVGLVAGLLAWFAILARGRIPAGLRDVLVWTIGYGIQASAYVFLVTGAYPDSDPRAVPLTPRPRHPVRLVDRDDPRRSRLTVASRAILAMPHVVWLTLWSIVVFVVALAAWLIALVRGALPRPLHRFFAAYTRYATHVNAFVYLAGGPFPGFAGARGSYPIDLDIDDAARQSRWSIAGRWLLAIPALLILGGLSTAMSTAAVGAWFWALVKGEMPRGLDAVLTYATRYTGHLYAYALLLTPAYPHSGPSEHERPSGAPEALAGPPTFATAPERPLIGQPR